MKNWILLISIFIVPCLFGFNYWYTKHPVTKPSWRCVEYIGTQSMENCTLWRKEK